MIDGIDSLWALSMRELSEYIPSRSVVHLSDVLWEFMPEVIGKMKDTRPTVMGEYEAWGYERRYEHEV